MTKRTQIIIAAVTIAMAVTAIYMERARTPKGKKTAITQKKTTTTKKIIKKSTQPGLIIAPAKKTAPPKIAIVLDDFGYGTANLQEFFSIGEPLTLSILPGEAYSREVAEAAAEKGYEAILHLPMEAMNPNIASEPRTIKTSMSKDEITADINWAISTVPGIKGVSNHMGSKATADINVMRTTLGLLKKKGLYFLDSRSTAESVCKQAASDIGVKFAQRDVFLDNESDINYIKNQLLSAKHIAEKHGSAIAIGHDRKNTAKALKEVMPEFAREGVEFVYLSELIK